MSDPKNRRFGLYLNDMLASMSRIAEYIEGLDYRQFRQKFMVVDAVIRNFEVIGEAAKHIPDEITSRHPEIPWTKMYGLRNIVSHEYFGVDYEMIWEIAKNELPGNRADLLMIIEKET